MIQPLRDAEGVCFTGRVRTVVFRSSRTRRDSRSMPHWWSVNICKKIKIPERDVMGGLRTSPPPKNMAEIETCSRSCALQAWPQAARCSRKTLVEPYRKITKDSTNSAEGTAALRALTTPKGGLMFQAQPYSTKQPIQRPSVSSPYQKKIPPLIVWARPLKTLFPRFFKVSHLHDLRFD